MKKNQATQPAPSSSEETDSDASSSSSEEDALPSPPPPPSAASKKSAPHNKPTEAAAKKEVDTERDSDDSASDSPIPPKRVSDGSQLKKPRSKTNSKPSSPPKTPAKRSLDLDAENSKRPKKEKAETVAVEGGKKSALFQRVWSDDDEIVLLKGIIGFKEEKGADPSADTTGFHDLVKNSLHVDFDRSQVLAKIRRLRKRYETNLVTMKKNATAHERNVFDLSKKIWGNIWDNADADQQRKSNTKRKATASKSTYGNVVSSNGYKDSAMDKVGNSWQFIGQSSISMGLNENIVKVGLELCSEDKKAEIEEMWKQLHVEESNLFLRKLDLTRKESEMITEALKSGKK